MPDILQAARDPEWVQHFVHRAKGFEATVLGHLIRSPKQVDWVGVKDVDVTHGVTPLMMAAARDASVDAGPLPRMARVLLALGADPGKRSSGGVSGVDDAPSRTFREHSEAFVMWREDVRSQVVAAAVVAEIRDSELLLRRVDDAARARQQFVAFVNAHAAPGAPNWSAVEVAIRHYPALAADWRGQHVVQQMSAARRAALVLHARQRSGTPSAEQKPRSRARVDETPPWTALDTWQRGPRLAAAEVLALIGNDAPRPIPRLQPRQSSTRNTWAGAAASASPTTTAGASHRDGTRNEQRHNDAAAKSRTGSASVARHATVREGAACDWPRVEAVHDAAFKACHAPLLGAGAKPWFDPSGKCFVADVHGVVQGFVFCVAPPVHSGPDLDPSEAWARGQAYVDDLFVHPDAQRQGLGALLMETAERYLAGQGCKEAVLACLEVAVDTHRFYQHCGWSRVHGRSFTCDDDGNTYRVYRKDL